MKMILWTLLFSLIASTAYGQNNGFSPQGCAISATNTLKFAIDEFSFDSQIKVEFLFGEEPQLTPKVRIHFLQHEPVSATIQWNSVVYQRSQAQLFLPELMDRVRHYENKEFVMKRVSPEGEVAVFETQAESLSSLKVLAALFLSQNDFTITATTAEGDAWKTKHNLGMTDASFRRVGSSCYPTKTQEYLRSNGERTNLTVTVEGLRLSPAAAHWTNAYGMTADYLPKESLLPKELQFPQTLFSQEAEIFQSQWSKLTQLLELKKTNLELLQTQSSSEEYTQLNQDLTLTFQEIQKEYDNFVRLTGQGNSYQGAITQQQNRKSQLEAMLLNLQAELQAQQLKQEPLSAGLQELQNTLRPLLEKVEQIKNSTTEKQSALADIQAQQEKLQTLFEKNQQALQQQIALNPVQSPWSLEEIEQRQNENETRQRQLNILVSLKAQLLNLVDEAQKLVDIANKQQERSAEYLGLVAQQRTLQAELRQLDDKLFQSRQVPNFQMVDESYFLILQEAFEKNLQTTTANRDYDGEFDHHEDQYAQTEKDFVAALQKIRGQGQSLIARVLCLPDVLVDDRNRTAPCLTVDDLLNEKVVDHFFLTLPPKNTDEFLGEVPRPWDQNISKSEVLNDRLKNELLNASSSLQELVDDWAQLRFIIWRWVTMQKEGEALAACGKSGDFQGTYSDQFYRTVFQCEKQDIQKSEQRKIEVISALQGLEQQRGNSQKAFETADQEYALFSTLFVRNSLQSLKRTAGATSTGQAFVDCILPLEKAEACALSIENQSLAAEQAWQQESQAYVDLVKSLVLNIHTRLEESVALQAQWIREIESLRVESENFQAQNNIEGLLQQQSQLQGELTTVTSTIASLEDREKSQTQMIAQVEQNSENLVQETTESAFALIRLQERLKSYAQSIETHCAVIRPIGQSLQSTDTAIYELFTVAEAQRESYLYSSCQAPQAEEFAPLPETLLHYNISLERSL